MNSPLVLEILLDSSDILRSAEISPVIFIRRKRDDILPRRSQSQVRRDNREPSIFRHHRQKARRNNVHTRKGQRLRLLARSNQLGSSIAPRLPPAQSKLLIEQQVS